MSDILLATKFYIPLPCSDLVSRPRLVQKISDGLACPLILVSAPAGFGKTTLLSDWRHSAAGSDWPLGWLSLENEDNDLGRFLDYLGGALEPLKPGVLTAIRRELQTSQHQAALTALLDHLGGLPAPFVLILEDYHTITAKAVHEAVSFLIEHMPPTMHLILSSRSDPPLSLARWRVRDKLVEIRADELRFTHEEIVVYLSRSLDTVLPAEAISVLETRTEGWIAGLKLAALSLRNSFHTDVSDFTLTLSGSHRLIADYLMEEVMASQPEEVRLFMMQTSVLPSLCGSLCDIVTGQHNGQAMLELLERENLFIIQLDDERVWYRYHHLFADLLRQMLDQHYPGRAGKLRRRASEWCLQNGYPECAIIEALETQDFHLAAGLIAQLRVPLIESGRRDMLMQWVESLPTSTLVAYPELARLRSAATPNLPTQRELEVLRHIAAGESNHEIAETLVVSLGTVKKHLNNIFAKLEVQNRTQAVARARELGLL